MSDSINSTQSIDTAFLDNIEEARPQLKGKKRVKPSEIAKALLTLKGKPYSLDDRKIMRDFVMDSPAHRILVIGGRQIEKSTTIAAKMLIYSLSIPFFNAVYVAPSPEQRKIFAYQRTKAFLDGIRPEIRKHLFLNRQDEKRVFYIPFANSSSIIHYHTGTNPDKVRSVSADMLVFDEVQDHDADALGVIEHVLFHSDFRGGYELIAGTAKTIEHPTHYYWEKSTQAEFLIKCEHCGHWNIPSIKNIGPEGLVCEKCGRPIDIRNGKIVHRYSPGPDHPFLGIRFPQIISPFVVNDKYLWKMEIYSKIRRGENIEKIMNEMLALPTETIDRPLTRNDLRRVCLSQIKNSLINIEKYRKRGRFVVGIDWGTGRASYTVIVVAEVTINNRINVLYMRRFEGLEAKMDIAMPLIFEIIDFVKPELILADWGFSGGRIDDLWAKYGRERVLSTFNTNSAHRTARYNREINGLIISKTWMMDIMFRDIKKGYIIFPRWEDVSHYMLDFTNVIRNINEKTGRYNYTRNPGKSDDFAVTTAVVNVGAMIVRTNATLR